MHRAFEVGMRATTCMQQHRSVLQRCRHHGINKTSNVYLAWELYMIPVGTTGHEHQERWGTDLDGFMAIRDMRPEPPSYLFDTYDPIQSGIPSAIQAMVEDLDRKCSVRLDSGDQERQVQLFMEGEDLHGIAPTYIFEDGYTADRTAKMETACDWMHIPPERRMYGYGGFLVSEPSPSAYKRNAASAVYKLCASGGPRMKFSGTPGKDSLPGDPVVFRPAPAEMFPGGDYKHTVDGMVGQYGETPPDGFVRASEYNSEDYRRWLKRIQDRGRAVMVYSPETQRLVADLTEKKDAMIIAAKNRVEQP